MLSSRKFIVFLQVKFMIDDTNMSDDSDDNIETEHNYSDDGIVSGYSLEINNQTCRINNSQQLRQLIINTIPIHKLEILFTEGAIQDSDISLLSEYLNNEVGNKIKILYLMSSELGNEQAKQVIIALVKSGCLLEELSFWENNLHDDLNFLCNLTKFNNSLRLLNFADNDMSTSIDYIIDIINNCPLLEDLDLGNCSIVDFDFKKLCLSFKTHPKLNKLCLEYNHKITDESVEHLTDLIKQNKQLKYINLSNTSISIKNISMLQAIKKDVEIFFGNQIVKNKLCLRPN